jgi:hypothetical protein
MGFESRFGGFAGWKICTGGYGWKPVLRPRVGATGCADYSGYSQDRRGSTPKAVPACQAGDLLLCSRCRTHRPALLCVTFLAVVAA